MQQTLTAAPGASIVGALLPDGSYAAAVSVDNPSGYWYQVFPSGSWIAPQTSGNVTAVDGASLVDVRAMATGPAGQASLAQGDPITVTLYDTADAPPASGGNPFAWLTPGQSTLRFLGTLTGGMQTFEILSTERAILAITPDTTAGSPAMGMVVTEHVTGLKTFERHGYQATSPIIAPVIPGIGLLWDVVLDQPPGTAPWSFYASAEYPVVELARGGQQLAVDSLSVVLASDQSAIDTPPSLAAVLRGAAEYTDSITLSVTPTTAIRGVRLTVDVTVAGTGSITFAIYNHLATGLDVLMLGSGPITTVGTYSIVVYPGIVTSPGAALNAPSPAVPLIAVFANNANPMTYAAYYELLV